LFVSLHGERAAWLNFTGFCQWQEKSQIKETFKVNPQQFSADANEFCCNQISPACWY